MLTESFVCSTTAVSQPASKAAAHGIFEHTLSPVPSVRSSFKHSSALPNCLSLTSTHVFAAQDQKAVVHVYNRERGSLEARVPFNDKISSLALIGVNEYEGQLGTLVLGMGAGRLLLWELATGRIVSTNTAHLQAVNNVSVDPTSNWILSASADSMIQVWSFLDLMSSDESQSAFGSYGGISPLRSFSSHRAPISALATGHSSHESNIVISASSDKVLHLWSMTNGDVLQTYLLNLPPLCMALDPADRAIYVGHEDGSIQMVDFQASAGGSRSEIAIPASPELLWSLNEGGREADSINSLTLSYDGMTVLSAHSSGKVHAWDVCTGKWKLCIHCHDRPVSNIRMLRPKGLSQRHKDGMTRSKEVIKPRFDSIGGRAGKFPVTAHFADKMKPLSPAIQYNEASFSNILCSFFAPEFLVDEGLAAFAQPLPNTTQRDSTRVSTIGGADDLPSPVADLEKQNSNLMSQLKEALIGQKKAIKQCMAYERDQHFRRLEDENKRARKKRRRLRQMRVKEIQRKEFMGQAIRGHVMMHEVPDDEKDLSSDTSEITD